MTKEKTFFESGQSKSNKRKRVSPKEILEQAFANEQKFYAKLWAQAEQKFQKAVDMADGFPPPKSKEDWQFLEKWLFL